MKKEIFDYYANKVAQNFGLTQEELFTKNRSRDYVDARWILYYICIERPISKASIQKFMFENGFSVGSTTILRGYKQRS